jgi:flagellar operon protein
MNNIYPIYGNVYKNPTIKSKKEEVKNNLNSFDDCLKNELTEVKFSKHAQKRMNSRNINITEKEISKMDKAVTTAKSKGVKETLILMNDTAFIVNIPSKTVITALDKNALKENVFTNIDGAIII